MKDFGFTWAKNIYWDNTKAPFQSHNPEWTAAAAVEFIERHNQEPFYLHYCTTLYMDRMVLGTSRWII